MRNPSPLMVDRYVSDKIVEMTIARLSMQQKRASGLSPWSQYEQDPVGFCMEILGDKLWSKQIEIMQAVRDYRRVAVHSGHETSKSFTAARLVAWWLSTGRFGESFALTTAPSAPQVKTILWREIARAYRAGKLPGRLNQSEWMMDPTWARYSNNRQVAYEELVAFGRKPSDYDPHSFQGIHARRVLAILDEACGIPEVLWQAVGSVTANDRSRILAIGNPDISSSYFAEVCKPDSGWHVIHVDGLLSPNFTDEADGLPTEVLEQLLGPTYVQELADDVGEDSAVYQSKVRGLFAEDDPQGVVPLSFVRRCQIEKDWPKGSDLPIELGMDVGAGGDESVIRERRGVHAGRTWRSLTPNWEQAVANMLDAIDLVKPTRAKIDVAGIGWGVVGRLKELRSEGRHDCEIEGINVGSGSSDPARFPKLRDQIWWEVGRELSRDGGWDLSAVDEKTIAQLIAPNYQRDSASRIKVEQKSETKKRIRRSPDDADALLLAFASLGGVEAADVAEEQLFPAPERERYTLWR